MYGQSGRWINMSGLNARLFPTLLPLSDALHGAPASLRAVVLQGTSPLSRKSS
jgi:hypothetical protein